MARAKSDVSAGSSEGRLKVAVQYQLAESWGNIRSVWDALVLDEQIEPTVILLPFIHRDYTWDLQHALRHLDELGLPYVIWDQLDLTKQHFDAIFFTSPYDSTRPPAHRFDAVSQRVPFTAYIPYGLEVGGGQGNNAAQYGEPAASRSRAVYVRSESVRRMFGKYCPTGTGHVVVSGHPRMDGLVDLEHFAIDPELVAEIGDRRAVLWNAHFSIEADQWSTFDILGSQIFDAFDRRPELALIFRPHPLLWKKMINLGLLDEAGIAQLKRELRHKGVIIDTRADHRHAFAASIAMLSDAGSFLIEYLATRRPLLYLENPWGLGLNEEGEAIVELYQTASTGEQVEAFLDQLIRGEDPGRAAREAAIPRFFHGFDGLAGLRVVDHMKAALRP